jgi:hypothetical protein
MSMKLLCQHQLEKKHIKHYTYALLSLVMADFQDISTAVTCFNHIPSIINPKIANYDFLESLKSEL